MSHPYVSVDDGKIIVKYDGRDSETRTSTKTKRFPGTEDGCRDAGAFIAELGCSEWMNSSSVDFPDEYGLPETLDIRELMSDGNRHWFAKHTMVVIIPRSDEATIGVLVCQKTKDIHDTVTARAALRRAVSRWANCCEEGQRLIQNAANHPNIGDVFNTLQDDNSSLSMFLMEQGFKRFQLGVYTSDEKPGLWAYDECVLDEETYAEVTTNGQTVWVNRHKGASNRAGPFATI